MTLIPNENSKHFTFRGLCSQAQINPIPMILACSPSQLRHINKDPSPNTPASMIIQLPPFGC
jgi:hypothetical protein